MKKGFTLLELIVVIVILGILATLGFTQYTKTVEKGRQAESKVIIGSLGKLAYAYWLQNGTVSGMSAADLGIGTGADQVPSTCRSSNYFYYGFDNGTYGANGIAIYAIRCTSVGKPPQSTTNSAVCYKWLNFQTGSEAGWYYADSWDTRTW
ncbi:MAG: prepilin-type N-terminal cleavage/methylation domain-containing protein [Candidatus Omnitrophica bacterium]|nr:prepilin-type N-terminal cleavage/methylation domain-containing protein [Candidatus Omnitrophota bacterium]